MNITIEYLSEIEVATGRLHDGWAGGRRRDMTTVDVARVAPTVVTVDVPEGTPQIRTGWGDRDFPDALPVWASADGVTVEVAADGSTRCRHEMSCWGYPLPAWSAAVVEAAAVIRAAAAGAERTRPDVAAALGWYRELNHQLDREHEAHRARWAAWRQQIARKFRRAWVSVDEQTVPGKCCVRSSRGKLLGYADVWNGEWLGTVERIAA